MRLYMFRSMSHVGVYAFSVVENGDNLPPEHGPWASLGNVMASVGPSRDDPLAADVRACGYHVVEARDDLLPDHRLANRAKLDRAREVSAIVQAMLAILDNAGLGRVEDEVTCAASVCVAMAAKWQVPSATMLRYLTDYFTKADSLIGTAPPPPSEAIN